MDDCERWVTGGLMECGSRHISSLQFTIIFTVSSVLGEGALQALNYFQSLISPVNTWDGDKTCVGYYYVS